MGGEGTCGFPDQRRDFRYDVVGIFDSVLRMLCVFGGVFILVS